MRALITGARGQDGTLLGDRLRAHGFEVLGIDRPHPGASPAPPDGIRNVDIRDEHALGTLISEFGPDHVYHLAASHRSSEQGEEARLDQEMVDTNFRATAALIATLAEKRPQCRILLAGTSQMYRAVPGQQTMIDEETPMHPQSLYGLTKSWARELLTYYRDRRGVFGSTAILFNHESTLRSPHFVTRKISRAAAMAKLGQEPALHLLDVRGEIDWSSAVDVVDGMRLALTADEGADYVFASGQAHRVIDVLDVAFGSVGLDWRQFATFEPPSDTPRGTLIGNAARARGVLGWRPMIDFETMIREMVAFDISLLEPQRGR